MDHLNNRALSFRFIYAHRFGWWVCFFFALFQYASARSTWAEHIRINNRYQNSKKKNHWKGTWIAKISLAASFPINKIDARMPEHVYLLPSDYKSNLVIRDGKKEPRLVCQECVCSFHFHRESFQCQFFKSSPRKLYLCSLSLTGRLSSRLLVASLNVLLV